MVANIVEKLSDFLEVLCDVTFPVWSYRVFHVDMFPRIFRLIQKVHIDRLAVVESAAVTFNTMGRHFSVADWRGAETGGVFEHGMRESTLVSE